MERASVVSGSTCVACSAELVTAVVLSFIILSGSTAQSQTFDADLMRQSSVVFVGTVMQSGAASFADVPVSPNTSIVKVDRLLQKPEAIPLKEGEDVTVQLNSSLAVGIRATFYTDGWIVGKGIALRELGHTALTGTASAADERKQFFDARKAMQDTQFRAQMDSADIILLGKVIEVRPSATETRGRITEHDPDWHDAVVKVQQGLKGVANGAEIVVRFPASMDVAFYGSPKLKTGDEQIMMLQADKRTGLRKAIVGGKEVNAYIIPAQSDLLGKEQLPQVMEMMKKQ